MTTLCASANSGLQRFRSNSNSVTADADLGFRVENERTGMPPIECRAWRNWIGLTAFLQFTHSLLQRQDRGATSGSSDMSVAIGQWQRVAGAAGSRHRPPGVAAGAAQRVSPLPRPVPSRSPLAA